MLSFNRICVNYLRNRGSGRIGFLDPQMVAERQITTHSEGVEDYIYQAFMKMEHRELILMPYIYG